jgi:hypothetical protein
LIVCLITISQIKGLTDPLYVGLLPSQRKRLPFAFLIRTLFWAKYRNSSVKILCAAISKERYNSLFNVSD